MKHLTVVKALALLAFASKFSCCVQAADLDKLRNEQILINLCKDLTASPICTLNLGREFTAKSEAIMAKKNAALNKIATALGVDSASKPIYLITVTRSCDIIGSENFFFHAKAKPGESNAAFAIKDLDLSNTARMDYYTKYLKGAQIAHDLGFMLKCLCCDDKDFHASIVSTGGFSKAVSEMNGCAKLVLFNEFFFGRNYADQNGQNGKWRSNHALLPYLDQCDKTIFYLHNIGTVDNAITTDNKARMCSLYNTYRFSSVSQIDGKRPFERVPPTASINQITSYHNGKQLTQYIKSSFCQEFQNPNWAMYFFGDGVDTLMGDKSDQIAQVLLDNVCTEICYDLYCGIRKQNNWSNSPKQDKQAGLLLIPSGGSTSILRDNFDSMHYGLAQSTIRNLPVSTKDNIIYILHADSNLGGTLATIHQNGAQVRYDTYMTLTLRNSDIKITVYKVE